MAYPSFSPTQKKIVRAFERPEYTWRTIRGVARETNVPQQQVLDFVRSHPDFFVRAPKPHKKTGDPLYTTRRHYKKKRGWMGRWYDISSSSSS